MRVVEMSYLKEACGVTRWERKSNENVYERCGMSVCVNGVGKEDCIKAKLR